MKNLFLLLIFLFFTLQLSATKELSVEEKTLNAILNDNFEYVEFVLHEKLIKSTACIYGKPLIIHAAIHNKAEMILLLANYRAMLYNPVCKEGKDIMDYAIENNAIHAQAQIIIIRA